MSFKIFTLQLTGKIKPVSTIENQREALLNDYRTYNQIEESEQLARFLSLESLVLSDEFKNEKRKIESLTFKGSEEENQLKEFKRLEKNAALRKYFKVSNSEDLKKFESNRESENMTEYYTLLDYVKEGQFEKDRREIKAQVFKGSVEEKHWLEYKRLVKSAGIKAFLQLNGSEQLNQHLATGESEKLKRFVELKNASENDKEKRAELKKLKGDSALKAYFKFERSKKLKLYRETAGSHDLKRYEELKTYIEGAEYKEREAYLKDRKKFEKSEAYKKQQGFKELAGNSNVKFVLKFEKSKLYKNYLDVKDSFDLKRLNELEALLASEEYKNKRAWLEDKKRWERTESFKQFQEYQQLQETSEIKLYLKYKDSTDFNFFKNWDVVFEDDFTSNKVDAAKWSFCSKVAEKTLGENFAMPGDLNLFTSGANIKTGNGAHIQVKKEKANGKVWRMPAGFVPEEFEYTSGMLTNAADMNFSDGIVEAKIHFNPVKQVLSSFYLAGENSVPRANLLEMGSRNYVGFSKMNGAGKVESTGLDISNLKKGSYIFTLEKSGSNFTWKINEAEVLTLSDSALNANLGLTASSLLINEISTSALPADFHIEWVKCYRKKA